MNNKILVIDDDEIHLRLLNKRLTKEGYEVAVANDGDVGLNMLKSVCPDLIVLDVEMPRMNGYIFMTKIAAMQDFSKIPVIVLTSHKDKQPIFEYKGIKEYLIKPLNYDLLQEKINEQFSLIKTVRTEKLLIIEGNETQRKLMGHFIGKEGFGDITIVETAEEGLIKAQAGGFDIVVINISLPDRDGVELGTEMGTFDNPPRVFFIGESIDEQKLKASGAACCVAKSSDYGLLIEAINRKS